MSSLHASWNDNQRRQFVDVDIEPSCQLYTLVYEKVYIDKKKHEMLWSLNKCSVYLPQWNANVCLPIFIEVDTGWLLTWGTCNNSFLVLPLRHPSMGNKNDWEEQSWFIFSCWEACCCCCFWRTRSEVGLNHGHIRIVLVADGSMFRVRLNGRRPDMPRSF